MLRIIYFLIIGLMFSISLVLALSELFTTKAFFVADQNNHLTENIDNFNQTNKLTKTILILGKPGENYNGANNTDTIILLHLDRSKNKIYLISIPRDFLISESDGKLTKINSLYGNKKTDLLLQKIEEITGLKPQGYIVFDLTFVKQLTDFLGGIDLTIENPIVDAVSKFSLAPGKYHINSEWAEFIIRSRYAPEGDFFRIKNQHQFIFALWQKIHSLPKKDFLSLIRFIFTERKHWETNLNITELYKLWSEVKAYNTENFSSIVLNFATGLLQDGLFLTRRGKEYGILPKAGVVKYEEIKSWLQSQIN